MAAAKFKKGDAVTHPASADGKTPAGSGVVDEVVAGTHGAPTTYKVKCDATGKVLPAAFLESELTAA